jgi:lysozyme family protein
MNGFDDAFVALMGNEGAYVDNPADPGGVTMWGITERVARACGYQGDMRLLPQATAKQIAKTQYWDPYKCDQFDARIGFNVFDAAYNGGHPALWLQAAAGVAQDGVIGEATIAEVRSLDPMVIVARFTAARIDYYTSLNQWPTFGKGWVRRLGNNLRLSSA